MIRAVFPDATEDGALRIAMCESTMGQNSNAYAPWNPNKGAYQIAAWAHPEYDANMLLDDAYNVRAAYEISQGGTDWSQWQCRPW